MLLKQLMLLRCLIICLNLERPASCAIFLFVAVNIPLRKIITCEVHISHSIIKKLWHPEHVTTGRVEKTYFIFAQDCLDFIDNTVEDDNHVPCVLCLTSKPTNRVVGKISALPLIGIVILKNPLTLICFFQFL